MRRLVLFVEGKGDSSAAPTLVRKLLHKHPNWSNTLLLDTNPFVVRSLGNLVKDSFHDWKRKLKAALERQNLGGVLLILDGDTKWVDGKELCPAIVARELATAAKDVGAGSTFSVAVVFARQEFETWLIAGTSSLAGKELPNGRRIARNAATPEGDLESTIRDAKGWLKKVVAGGYKCARDQGELTKLVDVDVIRARNLRSFRRLESALLELLCAIQQNSHIASPCTR
jgi:hypothetical protein